MKNFIEKVTGRSSHTLPVLWKNRSSTLGFLRNYYNARKYHWQLAQTDKSFYKLYEKDNHFDFDGVLIHVNNLRDRHLIKEIFQDTLLVHCLYKDNYKNKVVDLLDNFLREGSYLYEKKDFRLLINPGDIVIDAGAWVGDFSSLAAYYGAKVYAFEPFTSNYNQLVQTCLLNNGAIIPVKKGLAETSYQATIKLSNDVNSGGARIDTGNNGNTENSMSEAIEITTIDEFVTSQRLSKVDFIKADIEGFERNMLQGAKNTLRDFAPKLSLCTYHYPDDPEILAGLIKQANPDYTIVQMRHKLYAAVLKR